MVWVYGFGPERSTIVTKKTASWADVVFRGKGWCSPGVVCDPNKFGWHDYRYPYYQLGHQVGLRCAVLSLLSSEVGYLDQLRQPPRPLNVHFGLIKICFGRIYLWPQERFIQRFEDEYSANETTLEKLEWTVKCEHAKVNFLTFSSMRFMIFALFFVCFQSTEGQ